MNFQEKISVFLVTFAVVASLAAAQSTEGPEIPAAPAFDPKDLSKLNLAEDVDENYPIIFSIILFISLALILSLIAITVAIASMDPGRDSLIYRVTSAQRFKKDN